MNFENLLIELGTEELPPKALRKLAESFLANFTEELTKADLAFKSAVWYAAPRRLALNITELAIAQADKIVEKRGPAVSSAFDAGGKPTKAAEGWARGNGITVDQAERLVTDKGEWLVYNAKVEGVETKSLVAAMAQRALDKLPIPKPMRWGSSKTQFIRPVHTATMLLGSELIEGELLGIKSARNIRGHRFMGTGFELDHADNYLTLLKEKGKVIADYESRKALIKADAEKAAAKIGGTADIEDALLEEVTSLVEWPVVLTASFEEKFLSVPSEALVYTMKGDQKYFPVFDDAGKLLPNFIFVANIESKDPAQIISGNEKVVRPRLADAEFFFNTDKKHTLESRLPSLETVLFQQQLGTLKDKVTRISALAAFIAEQTGANAVDAARAGLLSKTDLMTNMVMEFTDTQGTMGMHYARLDGETEAVALAMEEQYKPKFSGDTVPTAAVSCAVALADKLDTLVGIFGIGQAPKGAADPFALRRAAIGVLRIIVENKLPLDLVTLIAKAQELHGANLSNANASEEVLEFLMARFRAWYQDKGINVDVILAVLARRPTRPADFDSRINAVSHFRGLEASSALAAANKRVSNILAKVEGELPSSVNVALLSEAAEQALAAKLAELQPQLAPLFANADYQQALTLLASLRESVDQFFEDVMVMADDAALRNNRLALLNNLREQFLHVADISLLQ
ncbi:glycine--tRNA ligase subunit beta [Shewanella oneidensis MR-1]|uniref:Glycine--tRNA ligase beta subunit n=1 Tax=Shewanella oneidensis (strain ATCC 700550 / JCM 31522 / CIP 106686 / LMG 19005 / NCIMB 14063 / MR-1) TaxID=211586 RepID=SYGB_SHEON|nr:glycine--tRNA ligase subunit beta [Shewanella oneidensis]Q8EKS6.1 RecName: Full=Glycine--tRNA ligase beta subunit; AltName: Full=Glycyl-tRNA synthetase beta subunit; Short=GlyRS [Shewanella oneidensis MR-1]AAN53101.1 glycyl-tRNA synthetase beta subunit GlyS [Shewanella oneidensis MR-1]MDX5997996.1 glycine--tRNA ligase subunit beta [Shewanella oneidensis]MEE2027700.1 Glycine--tRNA ligase beta subunit [Shewanella oneidensis]QKG95003.1 glycine--tRNA ligase subunit beta [Shewanella oneidensis M